MRTFLAALRHEWTVTLRMPGEMSWLFTAPLYTVIFMAITDHAGRHDLSAYAVLGPAVMSLIGTAIYTAGELIDRDRWDGVLELLISVPARFPVVVAGRTAAVMSVGAVSVGEAWLVAGLVFGVWVGIPHPWVFAGTLALTIAATAGIATVMAAVFVLARSARIFQNSLSYPLFVLGGVIVPVALLPGWLQPLSRVFYLSWASDLLRASTADSPVHHLWWHLGVTVLLAAAGVLAGAWLLERIVARVRVLGTLTYA